VGLAALGKALVLLERVGLPVVEARERKLTTRLLKGLAAMSGVEVFGLRDPDSARPSERGAIVTFGLRDAPHNLVAKELAEVGGIGVRNGCFCANLLVKHLLGVTCRSLRPMALFTLLDPAHAASLQTGLVRLSLGLENDESDVDTLLRVLDQISRRPRRRLDRLSAGHHLGTFLPRTPVQAEMEASAREVVERVYRLRTG
jgi:selenocysteine lyase/cysteine desulfurase